MPKMRLAQVMFAAFAVLGLIAGCGSSTAVAPAVASPTGAASSPVQPPAGTVLLTGALKNPVQVTVGQLVAMSPRTVQVTFETEKGSKQHTEVGVPLAQLIPPAALATESPKNDLLSFVVLAVGADGYRAAVAYGEISPDFGNRDVLLAVSEDGKALARPRLIVPGDVKGGRDVTDVVELRVYRLSTS